MDMKLELKHLASYLPYGLSVVNAYGAPIPLHAHNYFFDGIFIGLHPRAKPILHPLSDFTKEIEVNGKKFVPNFDRDFKFFIKEDLDYFLEHVPYGSVQVSQYQRLLEWHFDVFNLIENGLAIDVNTLETNPYK
jgi:hypothetical protein